MMPVKYASKQIAIQAVARQFSLGGVILQFRIWSASYSG